MSKEREMIEKLCSFQMTYSDWLLLIADAEELLAQPETKQEPVAWCQMVEEKVQDLLTSFEMKDWLYDKSWIPLYTAPPKREPLGLEIMDACGTEDYREGFKDGALYAEKCHGIGVDDE